MARKPKPELIKHSDLRKYLAEIIKRVTPKKKDKLPIIEASKIAYMVNILKSIITEENNQGPLLKMYKDLYGDNSSLQQTEVNKENETIMDKLIKEYEEKKKKEEKE